MIFESNGNLLVASGSGAILSYDGSGMFLGALVSEGSGGLSTPIGLAIVPEPGSLTLSLIALLIAGSAQGFSVLRSRRFCHNEVAVKSPRVAIAVDGGYSGLHTNRAQRSSDVHSSPIFAGTQLAYFAPIFRRQTVGFPRFFGYLRSGT